MSQTPRIIKANQVTGMKPADFNPVDTLVSLEERIKQANLEIEKLRQATLAELDSMKQAARQEGYQAGYAEGLAVARKEVTARYEQDLAQQVSSRFVPLEKSVAEVVRVIADSRSRWLAEWEQSLLELSCQIAERVVRTKITAPNDYAKKALKEILPLVGKCPQVTVYLHPTDAETIELAGSAWASATNSIGKIELRPDDSITPGGVKVVSDFGAVDASIETQLERIRAELTGTSDSEAKR